MSVSLEEESFMRIGTELKGRIDKSFEYFRSFAEMYILHECNSREVDGFFAMLSMVTLKYIHEITRLVVRVLRRRRIRLFEWKIGKLQDPSLKGMVNIYRRVLTPVKYGRYKRCLVMVRKLIHYEEMCTSLFM